MEKNVTTMDGTVHAEMRCCCKAGCQRMSTDYLQRAIKVDNPNKPKQVASTGGEAYMDMPDEMMRWQTDTQKVRL